MQNMQRVSILYTERERGGEGERESGQERERGREGEGERGREERGREGRGREGGRGGGGGGWGGEGRKGGEESCLCRITLGRIRQLSLLFVSDGGCPNDESTHFTTVF